MYRINRNIVECKDFGSISSSSSATVLIETLWNVKDTQSVCFASPRTGINRNIVECKGGRITISTWQKSVLIETLWNVKKVVIEPEPEIPRINRNIVECKGS